MKAPKFEYNQLNHFVNTVRKVLTQLESQGYDSSCEEVVKSLIIAKLPRVIYKELYTLHQRFDFSMNEILDKLDFSLTALEYEDLVDERTTSVRTVANQ